MVSLPMAQKLKEAGLEWQPRLHDFFSIPGTTLEKRLFVVSDMMIDIQRLFGREMITFNGAVEWSLDYITIAEVVWMPTEAQLRDSLLQHLSLSSSPVVLLEAAEDGCACSLTFDGRPYAFKSQDASDAYARGLLFLLEQSRDADQRITG